MSNPTETLTKTVDTETEAPPRSFSRFDKCDRCGFQAYFVVFRTRPAPSVHDSLKSETEQELLFCKHHGEDHAPALDLAGWTVLDFTSMLDKPLVSANVD